MCFSLPSIKCPAAPPSFRLLPSTARRLNCAHRFDYCALGNTRKLEGAAKHLIDGSEKRICRLSFEFYSPHVIEKCSKPEERSKVNFPSFLETKISVSEAHILRSFPASFQRFWLKFGENVAR